MLKNVLLAMVSLRPREGLLGLGVHPALWMGYLEKTEIQTQTTDLKPGSSTF